MAVSDLSYIQNINQDNALEISVYRPASVNNLCLGVKLFQANEPIPLSDAVHILENMNLRVITEKSYRISRKETIDLG